MNDAYVKAVRVIRESDDPRELLIQIARRDPEMVLKAQEVVDNPERGEAWKAVGWEEPCKVIIRAGDLIAAIRICRMFTGWGLKESKEAVERLRDSMK